ncbi:MAG: single-stranded DNA-binding protein [Mogibacterium sp.]|nr:single-stranded DNA-binding protein [Oscillospiraceae bacterium]MBR3125770.1 single-stranded DNA-binding protein [Mogibacterium sp.]
MLNTVAIMGRLVADPELRHTPSNFSVTSFTVAVSRSYVKQGTERQTDFIDVVAWRNTAEFICRYFKKGQMIAIEGSLQTRTYQDKEGHNRKAVEVLANNVYFTESRSNSQNSNSERTYDERSSASSQEESPLAFSQGSQDDFSVISDDDDLPF